MATELKRPIDTFIRRTTEEGTTTTTRQYLSERTITSNKVSGQWITFPDGSRFRRPTSYSKTSARIIPGGPQNDVSHHNSPAKNPRNCSTGGGGYRPEIMLTGNCPEVNGMTVSQLIDNPSFPTMMRNEAVTKALNKIGDQKANIGETLATYNQTLRMISNPASTLAGSLKAAWKDKSVKSFLRRSLRDIRRDGPLNYGAQKYLEYVYGWRPLMNDIYGLIEVLKQTGAKPLLLSGHGTSKVNLQTRKASFRDFSNSAQTDLGPLNESSKVTCQLYGRIDPNSANLRAVNQLGLLNPASLAWELVSWSFVIDWFVPIGPVLNALTATVGVDFVSGTLSSRTKMSGPYSHYNYVWREGQHTVLSKQDATGTVDYNGYSRQTLSQWPLPGFFVDGNPIRGDRDLKAIALMIVNLRNLK